MEVMKLSGIIIFILIITNLVIGYIYFSQSKRYQIHQERYRSLFDQNPDAVFAIDLKGHFISVNKACERVSGYSLAQLINSPFSEYLTEDVVEDTFQNYEKAVKGEPQTFYSAIYHADGHRVEMLVTNIPILIRNKVVGVYGIAKDVTDRKQAEEKIRFYAFHDPLTELPNRRSFQEELIKAVSTAAPAANSFAVLFLDIDGFKQINDSLGHAFGDLLLKAFARRLDGCVKESDIVSRVGGDEFTILLRSLTQPKDAEAVAKRILETLQKPFHIEDEHVNVTTSIGIALYPQTGQDPDQLLLHADMAMYKAKEAGKNTYRFFSGKKGLSQK